MDADSEHPPSVVSNWLLKRTKRKKIGTKGGNTQVHARRRKTSRTVCLRQCPLFAQRSLPEYLAPVVNRKGARFGTLERGKTLVR